MQFVLPSLNDVLKEGDAIFSFLPLRRLRGVELRCIEFHYVALSCIRLQQIILHSVVICCLTLHNIS